MRTKLPPKRRDPRLDRLPWRVDYYERGGDGVPFCTTRHKTQGLAQRAANRGNPKTKAVVRREAPKPRWRA